jgi:hypothetical protein
MGIAPPVHGSAMNAAPYVFISYARQDLEFATRLADDLRRRGIETWRDLEQIMPGEDWQEAIGRGLIGAAAALYIASANSGSSQWMEMELNAVINRGNIVIPLVIDDAGVASMPVPLQRLQWVDFRAGYDAALERLLTAIPELIKSEAPIAPAPEKTKGYVFLSYAEEDAPFAQELRRFLAERGYGYWDYSESDRNYHTGLANELEDVILQARATLSLLSPGWKRSTWTMKEYFFSEEVSIPVFLLRVKEVPPTLAIAGIPYIDFVRDRTEGFKHLDRELARAGL